MQVYFKDTPLLLKLFRAERHPAIRRLNFELPTIESQN